MKVTDPPRASAGSRPETEPPDHHPSPSENEAPARPVLKMVDTPASVKACYEPNKTLHLHGIAGAHHSRLKEAAGFLGMTITEAPAMDGVSACESIAGLAIAYVAGSLAQCHVQAMRYLERLPESKVVFLGEEDETLVEACLSAGAKGFIPSRFNARMIRAALELVLEGEVFRPNKASPSPEPQTRAPSVELASNASVRDYGLTQVEAEVLALVAQGLTNFEIAQRRGGSEGTVKVHTNRIFTKLRVRSRCEAIAVYLQLNNVDPEELRRAQTGHMDMKWLLATMTHERHLKGTVLFRNGDVGDNIYYVQRGIVGMKEIGVDMEPRALFGEIGVFAPERKRTCTAACKTDVDLFTLTYEEVRRCYFLNPQFAFYVMYLITQRLMADRDRVRTGAL